MKNPKSSSSIVTGWCRLPCLILAGLILAGCQGFNQPSTRPTLPANLSSPCPDVPAFDSSDWDALGQAYIDLAFQYAECKARHKAVVDAVQ